MSKLGIIPQKTVTVITHLQIRCKYLKPFHHCCSNQDSQKVKGYALMSEAMLRNVPSRVQADLRQTKGSYCDLWENKISNFSWMKQKPDTEQGQGSLQMDPWFHLRWESLKVKTVVTFFQTVKNPFSRILIKTIWCHFITLYFEALEMVGFSITWIYLYAYSSPVFH